MTREAEVGKASPRGDSSDTHPPKVVAAWFLGPSCSPSWDLLLAEAGGTRAAGKGVPAGAGGARGEGWGGGSAVLLHRVRAGAARPVLPRADPARVCRVPAVCRALFSELGVEWPKRTESLPSWSFCYRRETDNEPRDRGAGGGQINRSIDR